MKGWSKILASQRYLRAIIFESLSHPAWTGAGALIGVLSLVVALWALPASPPGSAKPPPTLQGPESAATPPTQFVDQRIALVIGNSNYQYARSLKNPTNNAEAVARALEKRGFKIIKRLNVTRSETIDLVKDFQKLLSLGGVGLFYYSGHAINIGGNDYIMPVDANAASRMESATFFINLTELLKPVDQLLEKHPKK